MMDITRRSAMAGIGAWSMASVALAAPRSSLNLTLVGQALLEHDLRHKPWPDLAPITAQLGRADVVFSNLETVIKSELVGELTREALTLHAGDPEVIDALQAMHINIVSTANNHAFDLGAGGIRSTLRALKAKKLIAAGSGETLADASKPAYLTVPRGKVALVAFATGKVRDGGAATATRPGVNEIREDSPGRLNEEDIQRVLAALAAAAKQADVVIAYQHNHLWGDDMAVTAQWQRHLARRCVEAGAGVYVAHGAPLLHGLEFHRDAPMFYSLGSFIFQTETPPGQYPDRVWDTLIVECRFKPRGRPDIALTPVRMNDTGLGGVTDMETRGRPSYARGAEATRILTDFAARSAAFGTKIAIKGERAMVA